MTWSEVVILAVNGAGLLAGSLALLDTVTRGAVFAGVVGWIERRRRAL